MIDHIVTLDVRKDICQGREPLSRILEAAAALHTGQALLIIAPFEPLPLYRMLARQGFSYQTGQTSTGDWEVLFLRRAVVDSEAASSAPRESVPVACGCKPMEVCDLDARGLEPPQPMVTILEALAALPSGAQLRARTDRRPMHLYAQLEERGFEGDTQLQEDGSFVTRIRHR